MIFNTVCNLLAQITGCDESRIAMKTIILEDMEATSDDLHELLSALELEFDISWDDNAEDSMITISDVVRYIEETM